MKLIRLLLDRLDEKTTWFAIGAFLAAFGLDLEPGLWEGISMAGMGLAVVLMALLPTKEAEDKMAAAVDRRLPERLRRDRDDDVQPDPDFDPGRRVRDLDDIYSGFEPD